MRPASKTQIKEYTWVMDSLFRVFKGSESTDACHFRELTKSEKHWETKFVGDKNLDITLNYNDPSEYNLFQNSMGREGWDVPVYEAISKEEADEIPPKLRRKLRQDWAAHNECETSNYLFLNVAQKLFNMGGSEGSDLLSEPANSP
jgi:hypothetical protein